MEDLENLEKSPIKIKIFASINYGFDDIDYILLNCFFL